MNRTAIQFLTTKLSAAIAIVLLGVIAINDNHFERNIMVYVVLFIIGLFYYKVVAPMIAERLCIDKVKAIVLQHETALSIQRSRLIKRDIYGNEFEDAWKKEIENFIENTIIKKQLTDREKEVLEFVKPYQKIVAFVDEVARQKSEFFNDNISYSDSLTGQEYEILCKDILCKNGWSVEMTKVVGDQGVDLIATKDNNRVAIQCKKYTSSIGNWAVQEVIAGKSFYRATHGVVVSNAPYTKSAIDLAKANKISLLHHNDLLQDDFFDVIGT